MPDSVSIDFEIMGIGEALSRGRLAVPMNQREYAWEERHVKNLLQDIENAMAGAQATYFLGTIVLTSGIGGAPEVTDGQQRLATTTILIAAIRDYFSNRSDLDSGDEQMVGSIETEFLFTFDRNAKENVPRLTLNVDDNTFFHKRVLSRPDSPERSVVPTLDSHHNIDRAARIVAIHIVKLLDGVAQQHHEGRLNSLLEYVNKSAKIIRLTVPDDMDAFTMFATLNDRGLRTSQADLVKNHLFKKAGTRITEAQNKWSAMKGALETLDEDDITLTYLRHLLIAMTGPTREKEVMERIESRGSSRGLAMELLDTLAESANPYVAIQTPSHASWGDYPESVPKSIETLSHLRAFQIRPLLLAVRQKFNPEDAARAFKLFVSWTVRILISGARSGTLEDAYAQRAHDVMLGTCRTVNALAASMADVVPNDERFRAAFSVATVSQHYLARYYLRAMEQFIQGQHEPEFLVNESRVITLEHICPQNPENNWSHLSPELAVAIYKRIGNMVLLPKTPNSGIGNADFDIKRAAYADSKYELTEEVSRHEGQWGLLEINDRQIRLADIALRTWPLTA